LKILFYPESLLLEAFMETWMIPTQNDPLGAVRGVLQILWETTELKSMLLPLNGNANDPGPNIIEDPEHIQMCNPFTPLMPINAAQLVPDLVKSRDRVAALLRPCELRTLDGMIKLERLNPDNLLTISVDCLGTLPVDEFKWRAQRKGSSKGLGQVALQFARQGGIVPYRYRAACQICESPEATMADVNIGVLGLPVRQYLLINIQNVDVVQSIRQEVALPADAKLLSQHQRVVARLAERMQDTRERIFSGLVEMLPPNIDSLVETLQGCDDCRACLDNCPICASDYPRQEASNEFIRGDVIDWLVSCSECGICEQFCPKNLPLTIIFGYIRSQLAEMG
jgi:formate dehydrogenase subunit beta